MIALLIMKKSTSWLRPWLTGTSPVKLIYLYKHIYISIYNTNKYVLTTYFTVELMKLSEMTCSRGYEWNRCLKSKSGGGELGKLKILIYGFN